MLSLGKSDARTGSVLADSWRLSDTTAPESDQEPQDLGAPVS